MNKTSLQFSEPPPSEGDVPQPAEKENDQVSNFLEDQNEDFPI
jgi:hypothetical protein